MQVKAAWADGQESSRLWRHDGLLPAAAVANRVRWQLDGWRSAPGDGAAPGDGTANEQYAEGGVAVLRLAPDLLVRAAGQQLALWGETVVSDRVARAAMRLQAMLGHEAVLRPALGGGRNPSDQVTPIPFGEKSEPRLAADRPWPGRVIGAAPGLVFPAARAAEVTDERRAGRHRQRPLRDLGHARAAGDARRAAAARHRLGRPLAAIRALVGPGRRAPTGPVPAGNRRRAGVAGGGPGRPVAGRGRLLVRGGLGLG